MVYIVIILTGNFLNRISFCLICQRCTDVDAVG